MPGMKWPSGRAPVMISEVQTGVTEGKLETQSSISSPRASSAAKVGASPVCDRPLQHVGSQRIDDDEDELALRVR